MLMICRGLQKALGVETTEALRGQLLAEAVQGRSSGLVGGLLRDAQPLADLGVAVAQRPQLVTPQPWLAGARPDASARAQ
ncbi:MAG TPA: hypothetical protein DDZ88_23480 [Verrucomicrobiales bacterium]|nr:hypothetical protein [Verrucomicrobiales bacterium]